MLDRRRFIGTLAGGPLASPITTFAQQPTKVARIGFLGSSAPPPELPGAARRCLIETDRQDIPKLQQLTRRDLSAWLPPERERAPR